MFDFITPIDAEILFFIRDNLHTTFGTFFFRIFTSLGNAGIIWIAAAVVMLFFRRTRRAGVLALGGLLINLLAVNLTLKPLIGRPRPWLVIEGFEPLVYSHSPSFPSGHTSSSFAFAFAVLPAVDMKWLKITSVAAATLMGLSRLYVGVHYPSDVVGGAIIGALCGLLSVWIYRKFFQNRFPLR
jgi:undecaprenyl-diphosphatase